MKISIVQGPYYPVPALLNTGAEKVWLGLGARFAELGHDVVHLSRRYPGLPSAEKTGGVQHIRVPSRNAPASTLWYRLYDLVYSFRVRRQLTLATDIVVTNCMWLPILLRGERRGRLYVHVARYPKGQMWLYRHAARLQAVSTSVAEAIVRELPTASDRVRVIPPFLSNRPEMRGRAEFGQRTRTVLYVGRIHPEKGIHLLVDAFRRTTALDWRLCIVGNHAAKAGGGGDRYLAELRASADDRIEFCGSLTDDRLNAYYRTSSVLVYPSLAEQGESFGMVPLEAMACGCPAVVSNLGCFRDYLVPDSNGWVFDHRAADPAAALAAVLERVMHNDAERLAFARRGSAAAAAFTRDRVADRYLADFAAILASNR